MGEGDCGGWGDRADETCKGEEGRVDEREGGRKLGERNDTDGGIVGGTPPCRIPRRRT